MLWIVSLLGAGCLTTGAEMVWRNREHRPSVVDDPTLWSYHRSLVSDNDPKHVVLLGASRMQVGFSTDAFRERFPDGRLTQLAIAGRDPVAGLQDLAKDEKFRGIVICSVTVSGLHRENWNMQKDYINFFENEYSFPRAVDRHIGTFLQGHLVVTNPNVRLDRVLRGLSVGNPFPDPIYVITRSDRSRLADYSMLDIEALLSERDRHRGEDDVPIPQTSVDEWLDDFAEIERDVQRVKQRGGRVVFVRFPSAGQHWERDQQLYPKEVYWDRMAAVTSADTIHFRDDPALQQVEPPDRSHLDQRDAPIFTNALLDELVRRGVLEE